MAKLPKTQKEAVEVRKSNLGHLSTNVLNDVLLELKTKHVWWTTNDALRIHEKATCAFVNLFILYQTMFKFWLGRQWLSSHFTLLELSTSVELVP